MSLSLRKRLERVNQRLRELKVSIPDWRLWDGYGRPDDPGAEVWRLEEERKRLAVQLSRHGGVVGSRGQAGPESAAEAPRSTPFACPASKIDPEKAKRRAIVRENPGQTAERLCTEFDGRGVPLLEQWVHLHEVRTWTAAYKNKRLRPLIQTLISKDRQAR